MPKVISSIVTNHGQHEQLIMVLENGAVKHIASTSPVYQPTIDLLRAGVTEYKALVEQVEAATENTHIVETPTWSHLTPTSNCTVLRDHTDQIIDISSGTTTPVIHPQLRDWICNLVTMYADVPELYEPYLALVPYLRSTRPQNMLIAETLYQWTRNGMWSTTNDGALLIHVNAKTDWIATLAPRADTTPVRLSNRTITGISGDGVAPTLIVTANSH